MVKYINVDSLMKLNADYYSPAAKIHRSTRAVLRNIIIDSLNETCSGSGESRS